MAHVSVAVGPTRASGPTPSGKSHQSNPLADNSPFCNSIRVFCVPLQVIPSFPCRKSRLPYRIRSRSSGLLHVTKLPRRPPNYTKITSHQYPRHRPLPQSFHPSLDHKARFFVPVPLYRVRSPHSHILHPTKLTIPWSSGSVSPSSLVPFPLRFDTVLTTRLPSTTE